MTIYLNKINKNFEGLENARNPALHNAAANNTKFSELIHTDDNSKHLELKFVDFAN